MNNRHCTVWAPVVLAAFVMTTMQVSSAAPPDRGPAADHCAATDGDAPRHPGPPPGGRFGPGTPRGADQEWAAQPPYLAGLTLTEDQQDRVFSILHAAAPAIRTQAKALQKAWDSVRGLSLSPQYDETRAKALATAVGTATSQLALLHAHADQEIFALLTAEQRVQIDEHHRLEVARRQPGPQG